MSMGLDLGLTLSGGGTGSFAFLRRQFLTFGGVNEFGSFSAWSVTGDFEVEFDTSTTSAAIQSALSGGIAAGDLEIHTSAAGVVLVIVAGVTLITGTVAVNDGKLNAVKVTRSGSTVTLLINGVSDGTGASSATLAIDNAGQRVGGTLFYSGVIANIKLTDLATPSNSRQYDMRSGSTTTEPNALNPGTNDLTLNNVIAGDWERFTLVGADWLGAEKVTNGGFGADTDWTKTGNWTISGGKANGNESTNNFLFQSMTIGAVVHREQFTISDFVSGSLQVNSGGAGTAHAANGTFSENRLSSGDTFVRLAPSFSIGFVGSVDNFSIKRILEAA